MNAKANIQPVPTALDHLRAAFATRVELDQRASEIMAKIERLAPIEAEVALAQSNLQQILQAEADKLQAWVDKGAKGTAPAVDAVAREDASRKLADAKTRLDASGQVKGAMKGELTAIDAELRQHRETIIVAVINVLGEEALRSVENMRRTSLAVLESEAAYFAVVQRMRELTDQAARDANGNTSAAARSFSEWLGAISQANQLSNAERLQATQAGRTRSQARLEKLQAGEDPEA